jgi:hypothetical protein
LISAREGERALKIRAIIENGSRKEKAEDRSEIEMRRGAKTFADDKNSFDEELGTNAC